MTIKSFSIGDVVNESWAIIKKNLWIFVATILGFYLISFIASFLMGGIGGGIQAQSGSVREAFMAVFTVGFMLTLLIAFVISSVFYLGFYKMALDAADGKTPQLSAFSEAFSLTKLLNLFVGMILFAVIFYIGIFLCIIPGLFIYSRLQYYVFFIVEKDCNAIDALTNSWNMTKGNSVNLMLLILVFVLINILGAICCGVGLLVTSPMTIIGFALVYRILNGGGTEAVAFEEISEENEPVV